MSTQSHLKLTITECIYPSGAIYGVFSIGGDEIGRADKLNDGWRVFGKRKSLPAELAAKAMIDGAISKAKRDEAHARKMLDALRVYCGGRLPSDGLKGPAVR